MRLGFGLPQTGQAGGPDGVSSVARRAEQLGFDSLWVFDRLLYPVKPQTPYPAGDGSLPDLYKRVLDPVETLTFVAGQTSKVALGTSVLNLPWYNPVLLARRLTTLDVLSSGRLRVGFGIGWSEDEYAAAGVPWKERGRRADEGLSAIKAIWTKNPVEVAGSGFKVANSYFDLKPVQKPHPPIYMAAYTPAAMNRVAREANGWFPVGIPLAAVGPMFASMKTMVKEAGRNPEAFELIVRGNLELTNSPISKDRPNFAGTLEQIAEDIEATKKLGASELVIDVQFSAGIQGKEDLLGKMEAIKKVSVSL
jgi:probable F420-dependent oxidoreductase